MLIAQISDCHIVVDGELAYGRVDTGAYLKRAVQALAALPVTPDLILATGDLTNDGTEAQYARFLQVAERLPVPLLPVAGNHDERRAFAEAFDLKARFGAQPPFAQYVFDAGELRILVLDTLTPGSPHPSLCAARLSWIERALGDERPCLIAMHHPPFPAGVAWMEPEDAHWADDLAPLVARHAAIVRIVCGHVHRPMTRIWAGAPAMAAPSTALQVYPDLRAEPAPCLSFEAPGFLLHQWRNGELTSFNLAIPGLHDTFGLRGI